ncbi:MAG: 30S ribosomal protein S6 [Oscillospiraceae bacterium]|jgi:small subunit ribosomal protein S6|nr:30S ribosomal protein S6 [Oscillospiraceae bacterium]
MSSTNVMADYETIVVLSFKDGEKGISELVEKFKNLISSSAKLEFFEEWGKKRLVYPIKKELDGYYVLFKFKSEPDFPAELDRIYNITAGVLRFIVVKHQEEIVKNKKRKDKTKDSISKGNPFLANNSEFKTENKENFSSQNIIEKNNTAL